MINIDNSIINQINNQIITLYKDEKLVIMVSQYVRGNIEDTLMGESGSKRSQKEIFLKKKKGIWDF